MCLKLWQAVIACCVCARRRRLAVEASFQSSAMRAARRAEACAAGDAFTMCGPDT